MFCFHSTIRLAKLISTATWNYFNRIMKQPQSQQAQPEPHPQERIQARRNDRLYFNEAFPKGFYDLKTQEYLNYVHTRLIDILEKAGYKKRIYDGEASAFTREESTPNRQEPILLHRLKASLFDPTKNFDTEILRVVIRGRGAIQSLIRKTLLSLDENFPTVEPDKEQFDLGYEINPSPQQ